MSVDRGAEIPKGDISDELGESLEPAGHVGDNTPRVPDKDRVAEFLDSRDLNAPLQKDFPNFTQTQIDSDVYTRYKKKLDLIKEEKPNWMSDMRELERAADERARQKKEDFDAMSRKADERQRQREKEQRALERAADERARQEQENFFKINLNLEKIERK